MSSTRLTSLLALITITAGLTLVARSDRLWLTIAGAALVAGTAIALTRHFWRENDRKRKQEAAGHRQTLSASLHELKTQMDLSNEALAGNFEVSEKRNDAFSRGILEYITQLELDVGELATTLNRQGEKVAKQDSMNDRRMSRSRDDILSQLSGVVGVYSVLKPTIPYPPFGGWAIGGDCAQRLVSHILTRRPRWIVEIGSGLSTVLAAQALEMVGEDGMVLSLEHEAQWLEQSSALVAEHGVSHRSEIVYAPLTEVEIAGSEFRWYDISAVDLPTEIHLIFIDGPPKATGDLARYPAVPLLEGRLAAGGVILMDDAARPDERAAVERWQSLFPLWEFRFHKDSKGTVEIIKAKR